MLPYAFDKFLKGIFIGADIQPLAEPLTGFAYCIAPIPSIEAICLLPRLREITQRTLFQQ